MPVSANQFTNVLGWFGLPGHWEAIIIILAILLLFGGKRLPELAKGLGRGLRNFKEEFDGKKAESEDTSEDAEGEDAPEDAEGEEADSDEGNKMKD